MRLALNATALLSPLTGIGQYTLALARQLSTLNEVDIDFFYAAYWSRHLVDQPAAVRPVAAVLPWLRRHIPFWYDLRRQVQNHQFNQHVKKNAFDVYHEPNILPMRFEGPTVITVHDLSWIRYPETHPVERVRAMNKYFESGLRQASALITDAQSVKNELMETFGLSGDRISAIPLGVDKVFCPLDSQHTFQVLNELQLKHGKYVLAVGTLEPRKNLKTAINAYMQLPARLRTDHPLVVIGMKGWRTEALENQMAPLIQTGQIRQLGYVSQSDLVALMSGARCLVYPSIYEGFGLPPLEAMACGTPVICSNVSSLPEVVGDAGVMVEPLDDGALMQAMQQMLEDDQNWAQLKQRSLVQAQKFTWQNCARNTVDVYKSVVR